MFKFQLFTILAVVSSTYAYSGGAPESVCDDMTPKHPVDPQASELPFNIQVSKKAISPGDTVEITIGKDKVFKGYMLEVRKGDKAVGQFLISNDDKFSKIVGCHGGKATGATHKNSIEKKNLKVKWQAPETKGEYVVYATVAEDGGTFWARKPTGTIKVA